MLQHNGDLRAFGAAVRIVPSRRFAIFAAASASPGGNLADPVVKAALDAELGPVRHLAALTDAARIAPRLDGTYIDARTTPGAARSSAPAAPRTDGRGRGC